MIQPILTLLQKPRPKARHDTLARELRDAAVGVRKGFDEVLAKTVELGVSGWMSVGMDSRLESVALNHGERHALRQWSSDEIDRRAYPFVTQHMQVLQGGMRLPLPDIHIATLESADGTMPDDISANARSTRDNGVVIDGHGTGPAGLALLVLVLGVVF